MSREKICYAASSGGHLEEILGLLPLREEYDSILITEKTQYNLSVWHSSIFFVPQVNRREPLFPIKLLYIFVRCFFYLLKERPKAIVTTGALMAVPVCLAGKLLDIKIIYIESIARVENASKTGKFIYQFADLFIVQWEPLLRIYPNSVLGGRLI